MIRLFYCLHCRIKREGIKHEDIIIFSRKRGLKRRALRGLCEECGTWMYRMTGGVKKGEDVSQINHVGQ